MDQSARQAQALAAVSDLARELDVTCHQAKVIKDSNNTIIHLAPTPVVAKVGTTTLKPSSVSLTNELQIGHYLAQMGAPIAPPTTEVPPGPHGRDGLVITLWDYIEHIAEAPVSDAELGDMLQLFHRAFAEYPGDLVDFTDNLTRARRALQEPGTTTALADRDKTFLLEVAARIGGALRDVDLERHPLHGEPHLDGNILTTNQGPLLVDFETACRGPYEWDLTSLEPAWSAYPDLDGHLVTLLSQMRSLCVSTWCWMQYGRAPEVDEAAHVHLEFLRESASGRSPEAS